MAGKNEEYSKFLSDVSPQKVFWVHNDGSLKNLDDLAMVLEMMPDDVFKHHVNRDKNDFANWINEVIGDIELAKDIRKLKTRDVIFKVIKKRISDLQKSG